MSARALSSAHPSEHQPVKDQSEWSDAQLLRALRAGRPEAARPLYDHLRPTIEWSLRRVLRGGYRDFEDLVQSTFERILRGVVEDRFEGRSSLRTWASAIAAHVALDALRRGGREASRLQGQVSALDLESHTKAEPTLEARAELRRVRDILTRMNPDHAETLLLHDVLGHHVAEIAEMKCTGLSATQSRLRRARRELLRRSSARVPRG